MEFLSTTSTEWPAIWDALAKATGDFADECPESGEVWQYMGTTETEHQFRHRNRPATARRITGQASQTCSARVYLNLDTITLQVARVSFQAYPKREQPATAIREEYSGAFDGFTVSSDADPGL